MINKEKKLICAVMVLVLICLTFFSSVAFGQVSRPIIPTYGNVSGTLFYSDGKTPFVNPPGAIASISILTQNSTTPLYTQYMDDNSHYFFQNIDTSLNPLTLYIDIFNSSAGLPIQNGEAYIKFNVSANTTKVMNVTTNRMSTN